MNQAVDYPFCSWCIKIRHGGSIWYYYLAALSPRTHEQITYRSFIGQVAIVSAVLSLLSLGFGIPSLYALPQYRSINSITTFTLHCAYINHAAIKTKTIRDSCRGEKGVDAIYLEELYPRLQDIIPIPRCNTNTSQR